MYRKINILNFVKKILNKTQELTNVVEEEHVSIKIGMAEHTQELVPHIYARPEHNVSRKQISREALKVLYRLKEQGYDAYLVGGCVRDLLLGLKPKDFDVVTNASPEEIQASFRNCRLIGRRFRLAHVFFGREIIEVATFRGGDEDSDLQKRDEKGRLLADNHYGTIAEDVLRRDFTVNALYYNIRDFSIVDYVDGMKDHQAGLLRLIGDPDVRYREDAVRMIRVIRFAAKLNFTIDEVCEQPLHELGHLLRDIPAARLYDEVLKLFLSGNGLRTFEILRHYDLFKYLYPMADEALNRQDNGFITAFITNTLENTDKRIRNNQSISPYFLISVFLWDGVYNSADFKISKGVPVNIAYQQAAGDAIAKQQKSIACTKQVSFAIRDVWELQTRFSLRAGRKAFRLLGHVHFRAAYDFLCLRAESGGADKALAEWWTVFQTLSETEKTEMVNVLNPQVKRVKKRRRRKLKPKVKPSVEL